MKKYLIAMLIGAMSPVAADQLQFDVNGFDLFADVHLTWVCQREDGIKIEYWRAADTDYKGYEFSRLLHHDDILVETEETPVGDYVSFQGAVYLIDLSEIADPRHPMNQRDNILSKLGLEPWRADLSDCLPLTS